MDTMNLKPKYHMGQKLICVIPNFYCGKLDCINCYPIVIKAITIYEDCIKYIDDKYNEIDEEELVPYDSTIIGEHVINEIEWSIDKCEQ